MKIKAFFMLIVLMLLSGCGESEERKNSLIFLNKVRSEVNELCAKSDVVLPEKGMQFNGEPANAEVLNFKTGIYVGHDNFLIMIFDNKKFVFIAENIKDIRDSSGPDYVVVSKIGFRMEGCSLEHLSEILALYDLGPEKFVRK